jgi:hypothetical protein
MYIKERSPITAPMLLLRIGQNRLKLVKIDENWPKSMKVGQNRWKLVKIDDNWSKSMRNGQNWWEMVKIDEQLSKSMKIGQNRWKCVESDENWPKSMKIGHIAKKWVVISSNKTRSQGFHVLTWGRFLKIELRRISKIRAQPDLRWVVCLHIEKCTSCADELA